MNCGATDAAGYDVGDRSIILAKHGTGAILCGDVITFAGDLTEYKVMVGNGDVSQGGEITIKGGLNKAIPAEKYAIYVVSGNPAIDRCGIAAL